MEEKYIVAFMTFIGVIVGLLLRDVLMQLVLFRKQYARSIEERLTVKKQEQQDALWQYVTPLHRAMEALKYRLEEIVEKKSALYLLESSPQSVYVKYKYISTIYRISAVLGWLRAYRKERSYLSEGLENASEEFDMLFASFIGALADGHQIEMLRFNELCKLWHIPDKCLQGKVLTTIASDIDQIMDRYLIDCNKILIRELHHTQQLAFCKQVALHVAKSLTLDIPDQIIEGTYRSVIPFFDIKEQYIYRDWQTAIGDTMIREISNSSRRFEIIGFGEFEERYEAAKTNAGGVDKVWIHRVEGLIRNLDTRNIGIFDARREQIFGIYNAVKKICDDLVEKLNHHRNQK